MNSTRWAIVGMLFVATMINYVDRQTLSILSPVLRREFHLSETGYANAVSAFLLSYTVMYSLSGRLLDRIGVRIGMMLCIAWWSAATMLTSLAHSGVSLAAYRFLLGIGANHGYRKGSIAGTLQRPATENNYSILEQPLRVDPVLRGSCALGVGRSFCQHRQPSWVEHVHENR